MEQYARIKALHIGKRKSFRILFAIEAVLLVLGIFGLFGKNAVYEYPDVWAQGQEGVSGNLVDFTGIALPKGTYRVQLRYATDTNMTNYCEITDDKIGAGNLRTNGAQFFSGLDQTDFDMWLLRDASHLTVHVYYDGTGMLEVQGLTIVQTNAWNRILLFVLLCLVTLVNCIYCYVQYDRAYQIPAKNKTVAFCLGLILLFAALPLTLDYLIGSGDLGYHLMRVEGIKDGIRNGQFPIRISPEWQQGYGYASPIFYGETILYVAALFRLIGFTVTTSFRLFLFVIAAATVLISYFCFKKMFGEPYIGVFCSMLYSLSVYRIYKTYFCGSWGETLGVMLLPLIVYGFYRVFTQDVKEESYKRSWLPLTIGFTLLLQSHLLTCEMVGAFTILLCLILWKKVFRPQTFLVLSKTVIYSVLLSGWFLVPFLDYMTTGDFVIHHVSGRTIQYRGLFPAHLLFTYFVGGSTVFFDEEGMVDSAATGVGIAPAAAVILLGYLLFAGKLKKLKKEEQALGKIAGGFSVLAMLMSLNLFPWDRIQAWNKITATLVSSIQFPNRFLTIANVGLTAAAGVVAKYVMEQKKKSVTACYVGGMTLLLVLGSIYLTDNMMERMTAVRVYNSEGMGTGYISGGEYLPYGADPSRFLYHDPVCTGEMTVQEYEKSSLGAKAHLTNPGTEEESAAFSLLYYKGYHAYDLESGEELPCYAGENCEVTAKIPAGFDGVVQVKFVSPWYWRAGEAVTLVTFLGMLGFFFLSKRGRNWNIEENKEGRHERAVGKK